MTLAQYRCIKPILLKNVGPEVTADHIGLGRQLLCNLSALGFGQIDRYTGLAKKNAVQNTNVRIRSSTRGCDPNHFSTKVMQCSSTRGQRKSQLKAQYSDAF